MKFFLRVNSKLHLLYWTIILLIMGTALHFFYQDIVDQKGEFVKQVQTNLNRAFSRVNQDHIEIAEMIDERKTLLFSNLSDMVNYPTFIYLNNELEFWTDNRVQPDDSIFESMHQSVYFFDGIHGNLHVQTFLDDTTNSSRIISIIPIESRYDISNQFLSPGFNEKLIADTGIKISKESGSYAVLGPAGEIIFSIEFLESFRPKKVFFPLLIFILFTAGIATFIAYLWTVCLEIFKKSGYAISIISFLLGLLMIRILIFYSKFPFSYMNLELFNSKHYASSLINANPGDLLINLLFLSSLMCFLFIKFPNKKILVISRFNRGKFFTLFLVLSLVLETGIYFVFRLMYSIGTHSQWPTDISALINLSNFSLFFFLLFVIAGIDFIILAYLVIKLMLRLSDYSLKKMILPFLVSGTLFFLLGLVFNTNFLWIVGLSAIFILFSWALRIHSIFVKIEYKTFVFILSGLIIIALTGAKAIYDVKVTKDLINKERFGNQLLQENDPLTEYFLAEAKKQIEGDVFIKNRLFSPFGSKDIIEDKIEQVYLSSYLDRYEIEILLFNSRGDPINAISSLPYQRLKEMFGVEDFATDYKDLFFFSSASNRIPRYLEFITLNQYGADIGYIILNLSLKKIIPAKVYPRLLLDERFSSNYYADQYNYALFKGEELVSSYGIFNYASSFSMVEFGPQLFIPSGFNLENYHHLAIRAETGSTYIISSPAYSFKYYFSNFSFLFILLTMVFLIFLIGSTIYFYITRKVLRYATKIQLFLNFAFFIPLIVISISSLTKVTRDVETQIENEYRHTAELASINITPYLDKFINNTSGFEELSSKLSELAGFGDIDVNLYNVLENKGKLLTSTQPLIFRKKLLAELVNPRAYTSLIENNARIEILDESIGKLKFKTAYVGVRSYTDGELQGILSIPFLGSQELLTNNRLGLISNILIIFTVIFLGFIFLSYFLSKILTVPLELLTYRLRKTSLAGSNEPLHYDVQDEIGQLVHAYNDMLLKLENSKKALAQSQKEAAWREMAKQVAHEIKNPLTPMKLTLQHLQLRLTEISKDEREKFSKSINSLLHNIDTLSDIATSFSNYAQMPIPESEIFDIVTLLKQTTNIYINNKDVDMKISLPEGEIVIQGDPNWLGRTFSNLIINGIQAVDKNVRPYIEINLTLSKSSRVLISIKDNGKGIHPDLYDKIFMPNFSTKYSGSGIGLAISKRAVEHAGGRIWFETKLEKGTTFFVELPSLHRPVGK